MRTSLDRSKLVVVLALVAGAVIALRPLDVPSARSSPRPGYGVAPLVLTPASVPFKTLAAAPAGGSPSNVTYTITGSAPFCVQGLLMSPSTSVAVGPGDIGDVYVSLNRIDGAGVSHEIIVLVDGNSGGFSPLDLALRYGGPLCASHSLELGATQFQAQQGPGAAIGLDGRAVILAAAGTTFSIN